MILTFQTHKNTIDPVLQLQLFYQMNKTILTNTKGCELRFSKVITFDGDVTFKDFSIKHVVKGSEDYKVGKKAYALGQNDYLIGSKNISNVKIDSEIPVCGICVDLSEALLQEVIAYDYAGQSTFKRFMFDNEIVKAQNKSTENMLGKALQNIGQQFDTVLYHPNLLHSELFYYLSECFLADQHLLFGQYKNLDASKASTNKKIFNALWDSKDYIDSHYTDKIDIHSIAVTSNISEYHFIRLFKKVFSMTPHQYIIQKRLEFSKTLLLENYALADVAFLSGFADKPSFAKSFRKKYAVTPNTFKKSN